MPLCRCCNQPFEPEGLAVYCSPDCAALGNANRTVGLTQQQYRGGGHPDGPGHGSYGKIGGAPPEPESEKEFQARVIKRATELGFKVFHAYDSRKSEAGFPDLVCVRERTVYMELKAEDGVVSAAQTTWNEALRSAGEEAYIFRPSQYEAIDRVLMRRGRLLDSFGDGKIVKIERRSRFIKIGWCHYAIESIIGYGYDETARSEQFHIRLPYSRVTETVTPEEAAAFIAAIEAS